MLAPIILFTYNRPEHLWRMLKSLAENNLASQSTLFIYSDGPKENASVKELEQIKKVRKILREKQWCGKIHIIKREKNMGLANSIIAGVSEIIEKFGRVIVLEDDLLISKNFLRYMNDALDKFENEKKVMQISGFSFPVNIPLKYDAFFLPFTTSWGWATWKRVWDNFDKSGKGIKILEENKKLRKKFDLNNSYPYYKMLKGQKKGKVDSWAIRFYLSVFLKGGLTLYPKKTMVNHVGGDGSGTHCRTEVKQEEIDPSFIVSFYDEKKVNPEIQKKVFRYLKVNSGFRKRILRIINTFFKNIFSW